MELTRRTDYACRIIRAAYESKDEYVSVSEVAEKENIPYAFARSIQHDLVHAGLLKTVRGAKGGLTLACNPSNTTLLEVLEAVQAASICLPAPLIRGSANAVANANSAAFGSVRIPSCVSISTASRLKNSLKAMGPLASARSEVAAGSANGSQPREAEAAGVSDEAIAAFVGRVREEGARLYRDLPWRNTRDPYAIWISEVMLQQTQVARVLTRWERFMKRFPSVDALSAAAVADVVDEWQGMGYNRRALALKRAADICSAEYGGALPTGVEALRALPGIGDATAAGSRRFPPMFLAFI